MLVPTGYERSSSKTRDPQMSLKTQNSDFLKKYVDGTSSK
jgi:hypothetical protein